MGIYINPGNSGFAEINDQDYVDKTLLIDLINKTVEKKNKLTCISRPRRFGKSYAAKMLTAYYDCTCDSRPLFADKKISQTPDYAKLHIALASGRFCGREWPRCGDSGHPYF
jgi:hypothetical protein